MNRLKPLEIAWIALNIIFLLLKTFFSWYITMENSSYKNKNTEKKYYNTWCNCLWITFLTLYAKNLGGFKDKVASLFNTNTPKQAVYGRGKKLSKSKIQKQSEENLINSIGNPFILKKETKDILIKGWTIRDIRTLFEKKKKKKKLKIE